MERNTSKEEENRLVILKNAIQEGINSGRAENFDPNKHLESLRATKSQKSKRS